MRIVAVVCVVAALMFGSNVRAQQVDLGSGSVVETVMKLKPGEYVWAPQIAPSGPLLVIINVKTQRLVLFRNGIPIAASTVSTGRPGYSTPTGIFTILQKRVEHYSSTYDNAPMPYMQRLTWRGVALHAGHLPGYPASHGCIRLPMGFAKLLFGVTKVGMTVVITDQQVTPRVASPPLLSQGTSIAGLGEQVQWHPEHSPSGPVSIIISAADSRALVLRNGLVIGSSPIRITGTVADTWAYALRAIDSGGRQHWVRLTLSKDSPADQSVDQDEWRRFHAPEQFRQKIAQIVQPGTTIIVTADSIAGGGVGGPSVVLQDGLEN